MNKGHPIIKSQTLESTVELTEFEEAHCTLYHIVPPKKSKIPGGGIEMFIVIDHCKQKAVILMNMDEVNSYLSTR